MSTSFVTSVLEDKISLLTAAFLRGSSELRILIKKLRNVILEQGTVRVRKKGEQIGEQGSVDGWTRQVFL